MADLAWHVSLLRLLMFGFSSLYQDLPHTVAYTERILAHSTLKQVRTVVHNITLTSCQATYTWPGYLPSPHLTSGAQTVSERRVAGLKTVLTANSKLTDKTTV